MLKLFGIYSIYYIGIIILQYNATFKRYDMLIAFRELFKNIFE